MKSIELSIPLKVFSINQMTYRDVRFKSAAFKDWATKVVAYIEECEQYKELMDIAQDHKLNGGIFDIEIEAVYPHYEFYNKQGSVSSKTIDVTNFEKPLIDIIFGQIMDVNDKYIVNMVSCKIPGSHHHIKVSISLLD